MTKAQGGFVGRHETTTRTSPAATLSTEPCFTTRSDREPRNQGRNTEDPGPRSQLRHRRGGDAVRRCGWPRPRASVSSTAGLAGLLTEERTAGPSRAARGSSCQEMSNKLDLCSVSTYTGVGLHGQARAHMRASPGVKSSVRTWSNTRGRGGRPRATSGTRGRRRGRRVQKGGLRDSGLRTRGTGGCEGDGTEDGREGARKSFSSRSAQVTNTRSEQREPEDRRPRGVLVR